MNHKNGDISVQTQYGWIRFWKRIKEKVEKNTVGNLKILKEDYTELKKDFAGLLEKSGIEEFENTVKNRWNVYWMINNRENNFKYSRERFDYLKDDNIDSALKRILNEWTKERKG